MCLASLAKNEITINHHQSLMDVILALECMWVPFLVFNSFNLNGRVEKLVLATKQVSHL